MNWGDSWVRAGCGWTPLHEARGISTSNSFINMKIKHICIRHQRKKLARFADCIPWLSIHRGELLAIDVTVSAHIHFFIISCWYLPTHAVLFNIKNLFWVNMLAGINIFERISWFCCFEYIRERGHKYIVQYNEGLKGMN